MMANLWAGMPTGLTDNYANLVSEEKQELINSIMYDMNGYINQITEEYIRKYLDSRDDDNPYLFVSVKQSTNLGASSIGTLIRKLGKRANVEHCHPHRFRRTMATRAIKNGVTIEQVRIILGHESIETTKLYCMVDQDDAKNAYNGVFTDTDENVGISTIETNKFLILSEDDYIKFKKDFEDVDNYTSKDLMSKYGLNNNQYGYYRDNLLKELGWESRVSKKSKGYYKSGNSWIIAKWDKELNKNIYYGSWPTENFAKFIISELKKVNWDREKLQQIIEDNNLDYPKGNYIQKNGCGNYYIVRRVENKNVYYGTYPTYDACLPIIEELFSCGWDKSQLPRIRSKFDVNFDSKRNSIFNFIVKIKSNYVVKKYDESQKLQTYYSSPDLVRALYERDALVRANWDEELWVEQEDHYTYIPELIPEFETKNMDLGKKYIQYRNNGFRVSTFMKDLGKIQTIGTYKTLGEAQRVSLIVQKHEKNYEAIIRELEARNIKYAKMRDKSMGYVYKKKGYFVIEKTLKNSKKYYCSFKTLEEAIARRDELIAVDWDESKLKGEE